MNTFRSVALLLMAACVAHAQFSNGYSNRRLLTVPAAQACTGAGGSISGHPVRVEGTYAYLATTANGGDLTSSSGNDIRFETAAGAKLDHELVSYDETTGALYAWVELPSISCSADTTFWLYYTSSGAGVEENPSGVWPTSTYSGVWHLEEDPSGGAGSILDSTSNANHGTPVGTWASGDSVSAIAGNGLECGGTDQMVGLGDLKPSPMTALIWAQGDQTNNDVEFAALYDSGSAKAWGVPLKDEGSNRGSKFSVFSGGFRFLTDGVDPAANWSFVAGIANSTSHTLYVNGSLADGPSTFGLTYGGFGDQRVEICGDDDSGKYNGRIDEFWLLGVELSADAIRTLWNNYNDQASFLTIGAAEQSGGQPAPGPARRKPVIY